MSANDNVKYNGLILRIFLGLTVLFWGYEKLVIEKLIKSYTVDYGSFMLVDVQTFLQLAGWGQIIMGICLIMGLFSRIQAAIAIMMGLVTIIVPGLIIRACSIIKIQHRAEFSGFGVIKDDILG